MVGSPNDPTWNLPPGWEVVEEFPLQGGGTRTVLGFRSVRINVYLSISRFMYHGSLMQPGAPLLSLAMMTAIEGCWAFVEQRQPDWRATAFQEDQRLYLGVVYGEPLWVLSKDLIDATLSLASPPCIC